MEANNIFSVRIGIHNEIYLSKTTNNFYLFADACCLTLRTAKIIESVNKILVW